MVVLKVNILSVQNQKTNININNKKFFSNPKLIPLSPKIRKLFKFEAESPKINKVLNKEEKKYNKKNKENMNKTLFGPINNNKEEENKESKDKENNINKEDLLKNASLNSNNSINVKKEEKETINLFKLKELKKKMLKKKKKKKAKSNVNL